MSEALNPNREETAGNSREKTIIRTSIIGIIANVFLAAFKAIVGLMSILPMSKRVCRSSD